MDAGFQSKYVRTFAGEPGLHVSITTPNNGNQFGGCWYGHLYNFNVGGWEQKFAYCGTGTVYLPAGINPAHGWSAWESYNLVSTQSCPTIEGVRGMFIQMLVSATGGVQYLTDFPHIVGTGSSSAYCWTNVGGTPYTFTWPAAGIPAAWLADTPSQ